MSSVRLPWFRVHIILLNDPGRLISTHLMHTGLVSGWAGVTALYELIVLDPTDLVFNPVWRQGSYVLPYISRLGVIRSSFSWSLGINSVYQPYWSYEVVAASHIALSDLLALGLLGPIPIHIVSDGQFGC